MALVSIIIRTYNNGKYLRKTIESALNQNFSDYEIVVINDGSTDNTKEILESFKSNKLRIINQENQGPFKAAVAGLKKARGDYITFLDGDDELLPDTLLELHKAFSNEEIGFSYCDYYEVDLNDGRKKIVSLENIFNCLACGILFRFSVIKDVGFWNPDFMLTEYDFIIRVMKKYKGGHIRKPLYIYKRHSESMTADKEWVEKAKKQIFDKYGVIEGFKKY